MMIHCKPSSPLDTCLSDPTKPNPAILLRAQPDPTITMNKCPSFSRCLAGAHRTPPKTAQRSSVTSVSVGKLQRNPHATCRVGPPVWSMQVAFFVTQQKVHRCGSQAGKTFLIFGPMWLKNPGPLTSSRHKIKLLDARAQLGMWHAGSVGAYQQAWM